MNYIWDHDSPVHAINQELRRLRLESTEESLHRAIYDEQEALLDYDRRIRRTANRRKEALRAACESYLQLIERFLAEPEYVITPGDILSYRCKAAAWAIAQRILEGRRT